MTNRSGQRLDEIKYSRAVGVMQMWLVIGLIVGVVIGLIFGVFIGFSLYKRAGAWD